MTLAEKTLEIARSYLNVREVSGPNRGPDVERFLKRVGCPPGESWCAAFVTSCVYEAEAVVGGPAQFKGSAGALRLFELNPGLRIQAPVSGSIFIIDHGAGKGHTGLVESVNLERSLLVTLEGNTGPGPAAPAQDRNGDGVYKRIDRKISDCCGYLAIR